MKTSAVTTVLVLAIFIFACKKTETPTTVDCSGTAPTYTANAKAILDLHCATAGCHDAGSKKDGKDLSTYAAAKTVASANSFLGSIQQLSGYTKMPEGASKLSDADIKTLSCWVQNGMPQ
ncbi:MAG: hypothetical protein IT257_07095 [Chitinophagaceae bacterium]|nr:hypothetical protein [Chitinophagaceae bacterium]